MKIVDDYVSVNDVVPESFGFTSEDDIAAKKTDDLLLLQVERRRDLCFEEFGHVLYLFFKTIFKTMNYEQDIQIRTALSITRIKYIFFSYR